MLLNREAALAWEFKEIGQVHPDVAPPQEIWTVDHELFQVPNFNIPQLLIIEAV